MDIRQAIHSAHARTLDTEGLRRQFLVPQVFLPGELTMTYSHIDRIVVGGISPLRAPVLLPPELGKTYGVAFFLQRRELGLINIGGPGWAKVDGVTTELGPEDALYVGQGAREVSFGSFDPAEPAKFYYNSVPAHRPYPTCKVTLQQALHSTLGDLRTSNRRTINKYFDPAVLPTCQLAMGMTRLEPGNLWNTMPCHTHERRMEVYFYFRLPPDACVFHMMGEPQETRHLVVRNEQAVINPSWSIHTGVGTQSYTFIWGMAGENQTFDDMDQVRTAELR